MPNPAPTPVLDGLAQGGLRFTRMFVNPSCTPSRATMFTGRYAFRSGCTMALSPGAVGINAGEVLLPVPLADAGYQTALIGKWHLGNRFDVATPNTCGWSHFEGILDSGVPDPYHWTKITDGATSVCTGYIMTEQVDSAISWIQNQTGPWALALTVTLPHVPYHSPPASLHTQDLTGLDPLTTPRPFFLAMVEAMDNEIGRLLSTLGPAVLANTNVVVIADNGTENSVAMAPVAASHAKGSLFEYGSHVPMIVKGPAVTTPGSTCDALLSGADLFPTLLDMCGIAYPSPQLAGIAQPLDGVSFVADLADPSLPGRAFVYSEIDGTPLGQGYTVRTDDHRLIRYMRSLPQHQEFYDLAADPLEETDLLQQAFAPGQDLVFADLMAKVETIRDDGWAELFGTACTGPEGLPFLRTQTNPRLGTMFFAYSSGLSPSGVGTMGMIGFSRDTVNGFPLPVELSVFGMPTCEIAISPDMFFPFNSGGYGAAAFIPPDPQLYMREFYLQAVLGEPNANAGGLVWSRGLRCVIGR